MSGSDSARGRAAGGRQHTGARGGNEGGTKIPPPAVPHAPFNFVHLSETVWPPNVAQPSHDIPFRDGVCGTLTVELLTSTPLMVGGERSATGASVSFFKVDGRKAIPGSSLRGLLRSVLEIGAFGRMSKLDDRRLGIRDLTNAGEELYRNRMIRLDTSHGKPMAIPKVRAGWLTFDKSHPDGPRWVIAPCDMIRIEHWQIEWYMNANFDAEAFGQRQAGPDRRRLILDSIGTTAIAVIRPRDPVRIERDHGDVDLEMTPASDIASCGRRPPGLAAGMDCTDGWIVVTGHTGPPREPDARPRHREFIFTPATKAPFAVPPAVWRDFVGLQDHADPKSPWSRWSKMLTSGEIGGDSKFKDGTPKEPGIPVFWLPENSGDGIASLGLAQMFKVAYRLSTHDLVRAANPDHLASPDSAPADVPELLFGSAAGVGRGLRGRVRCGLAFLTARAPSQVGALRLVLNSPKPSYYPFYVGQDARPDGMLNPGAKWQSYEQNGTPLATPRIGGFKRYPVHATWHRPQADQGASAKLVTTLVDPEGPRATFTFQIDLHNLRPFELGALVWALGFGEDPSTPHQGRTFSHSLGMARPYGLGAVTVRVTDAILIRNALSANGTEDIVTGDDAIGELRHSLTRLEKAAEAAVPGWSASSQLRQLRAMATPRDPLAEPKLSYMRLQLKRPKEGLPAINDFVAVKNLPRPRTLPAPDWKPG